MNKYIIEFGFLLAIFVMVLFFIVAGVAELHDKVYTVAFISNFFLIISLYCILAVKLKSIEKKIDGV